MKKNYVVSNHQARLLFTQTEQKSTYTFAGQTLADDWRTVTQPGNFLVSGNSFNLSPNQIIQSDQGVKTTGSLKRASFEALIKATEKGWFKFQINFKTPKPLRLSHQPFVEPAIFVQLPTISVQKEGGLIWEQTLIANPVTDSQGIQATDLPASYYYDPATETEWFFYLDWESLTWASHENIFGVLGGECGLYTTLVRDAQTPQRERFFGFRGLNPTYAGKIFPAGNHQFVYYLKFQPASKPTEWEANERLIQAISPFVKKKPCPKGDRYSWQDIGEKCLNELIKKPEEAQIDFGQKGLGLRAYAKLNNFESPNPDQRVELMTQMDLLWPLFWWRRLEQPGYKAEFHQRLNQLVPHFFDSSTSFMGNWYPHQEELLPQDQETWYFLENGLVKLGWLALFNQDSLIKDRFLAFAERACQLARQYQYLFPLRYHWRQQKTAGSRKNYIAGGLYAYGMVLAYWLTKEEKYLEETKKALTTVERLPLDLLNHEPQQTGFAALAAYHLFESTKKTHWKRFCWQLICHQLRMFYWYTDPTVLKALGCDTAGQARSFPSKIYPVIKHNPAFKENFESVLPWLYLLAHDEVYVVLLDLLNLARKNNFYYFDDYQGIKNPSWIPLESLPALPESGKVHVGGGVGHAVYGAGEVLWAALMYEAVATAENKDILIVCLDYLNPKSKLGKKARLIVFNPTTKPIQTKLNFHFLPPAATKIRLINKSKKSVKLEKSLSLSLAGREYCFVEID